MYLSLTPVVTKSAWTRCSVRRIVTWMPLEDFKNRWVLPGDEKVTDIPVMASSFERNQYANLSIAYNSYNYSTARIASGAFVRLKEVSLLMIFRKNG